jgi:hypothetical protein
MAQGDISAVEASYEAWRRCDADLAASLCHPDVQVQRDGEPTLYRGHDGLRQVLIRELDGWAEVEIQVDRLLEREGSILGLATFRGTGRGSGIEAEHFLGHLWSVESAVVTRICIFHDRDRALAAFADTTLN